MNTFRLMATRLFNLAYGPGGVILTSAINGMVKDIGVVETTLVLEKAKQLIRDLDDRPGRTAIKANTVHEVLVAFARANGIPASRSIINFTVEAALRSLRAEYSEVK